MLNNYSQPYRSTPTIPDITKLRLPQVELLYVDLFCGAGGVTSGVVRAKYRGERLAKVLYCVNHDYNAIQSHKANHQRTKHSVEDIRTMNLEDLIATVKRWRQVYPNAKLCLWASLECTNFSKAKGGLPRDADSRTLAYSLFRYIEAIDPDYIQIENVVEFMAWGPMRIRAKKTYIRGVDYPYTELSWIQNKKTKEWGYGWQPIEKERGADYMNWKQQVQDYGYEFEHRVINCADIGAYTSRRRYFGIFAKPGLPIVFPQQTHYKHPKPGQKKWKAVRRVLELNDHGESIFNRSKPLVENTLQRIYAGLIKYVAGGQKNFIAKYYSGKPQGKVIPTTGPAGTLRCSDGQGLVTTEDAFMLKYNSMSQKGVHHPPSINDPSPVVDCRPNSLGLVTPQPFLQLNYTNGGNLYSVEDSAPAVPTKDRMSIVNPEPVVWIDKAYTKDHNHQSAEEPLGSLTGKDKFATATVYPAVWIDREYTSGGIHSSIEDPIGSLPAIPKANMVTTEWIDEGYGNPASHKSVDQPAGAITGNASKMNKIAAEPILMDFSYGHDAKDLNSPCPTITADRRYFYLLNPQYKNKPISVNDTCFTLIAHMDKAPPHLLVTEEGNIGIEIYDTDSPTMIKIKEFMSLYGLSDIKMRMLKMRELKLITGFSADYKLIGTQAEQKKFIGNAVPVALSKAWAEALSLALRRQRNAQRISEN